MVKQLILVLALLTSPAWATWTLVQTASIVNTGACTGTTSCAITVASTGTGNLIVLAYLSATTTAVTISSVSGGGTYTHCTNCSIFGVTTGSLDMSYTLASVSGATTITMTLSATASVPIGMMWEFHSTTGFALDTSNTISDATCTACAGPSLTLTGANDVIAAAAANGGTGSGVTGTGWVNDQANPSGDSMAHALNVATMSMTFTQTSSILRAAAMAFKETSAVTCTNYIALLGAGCK